MPCYRPISAWLSKFNHPFSGKRIVKFLPPGFKKPGFEFVGLPCGKCIGCRLEWSRQWMCRIVHESKLSDENCFITLTYNDENLPAGGNLDKKKFTDFMKRLRFYFASVDKRKRVRFFQCGEYGTDYGRPHHHLALFGVDFSDKSFLRKTETGYRVYTSEKLGELWPYGFHEVGELTEESAGYVARYVTDKLTDNNNLKKKLVAEYVTMSRKPGIGFGWFKEFKSDVLPDDKVIIKGQKRGKAPNYYVNKVDNEAEKVSIKERRKEYEKDRPDNSWARLKVREAVKEAQLRFLKREMR